jgi:hypothetical protein
MTFKFGERLVIKYLFNYNKIFILNELRDKFSKDHRI